MLCSFLFLIPRGQIKEKVRDSLEILIFGVAVDDVFIWRK